jgi:hypothetical protein
VALLQYIHVTVPALFYRGFFWPLRAVFYPFVPAPPAGPRLQDTRSRNARNDARLSNPFPSTPVETITCLPTCLVPIWRTRPVCARDHPQSSASSSTRVLTPHHICHDRCSISRPWANLGFVDCEQAHNRAPPTLGRPTSASRTLTTAEKPTAKLKAWGRDVCRDPTWELLSVPESRATSICQNLLLLNPRGTLRKSHLRPSMPSLCATSAQIDKMGLSMG